MRTYINAVLDHSTATIGRDVNGKHRPLAALVRPRTGPIPAPCTLPMGTLVASAPHPLGSTLLLLATLVLLAPRGFLLLRDEDGAIAEDYAPRGHRLVCHCRICSFSPGPCTRTCPSRPMLRCRGARGGGA